MEIMMSWYVETLLRNSIEIKSKHEFDSDEYNDLLFIERKIESLKKDGIISSEEIRLIKYVEDGKPLVESKKQYGKNRISLAKDFSNLCTKIAFYSGGYFTNDGYADYMKTKYGLSDEQVGKMLEYMKSKYKNKLIRKIKNNE